METANFNESYEQYKQMLFKICMLHLKNKEDVQDVLQNTFIKLFYKSPPFQDEEHQKRWLIRIAINECKNHQTSFWKRKVELSDEYIVVAKEEDKELLCTIQELPFTYRNVVHLFYYEKYSIKEISKLLDISEAAVKMRLKRAKETLKKELEEY